MKLVAEKLARLPKLRQPTRERVVRVRAPLHFRLALIEQLTGVLELAGRPRGIRAQVIERDLTLVRWVEKLIQFAPPPGKRRRRARCLFPQHRFTLAHGVLALHDCGEVG